IYKYRDPRMSYSPSQQIPRPGLKRRKFGTDNAAGFVAVTIGPSDSKLTNVRLPIENDVRTAVRPKPDVFRLRPRNSNDLKRSGDLFFCRDRSPEWQLD